MAGHLFAGVTDATMTHNEGWHFCRLGRMLERADKTSRILDVKYFLLLPTAADVGTTVRRHPVGGRAALGQRVRDVPEAPRPHRARSHRRVPAARQRVPARHPVLPRCGRASRCTPSRGRRPGCSGIRSSSCSASSAPSSPTPASRHHRGGLHEYLDRLQTKMNQVGNGISETFFAARRRAARPQAGEGRTTQAQSSCERDTVARSCMAIHVALSHRTSYRYDRLVALSPHVVRLRPAPHCRTPILELLAERRAAGSISSTGSRTRTATTSRGSCSRSRRDELLVDVDLVAELSVINPFDFFLEPSAETFPFAYEPWLAQGARAVPRSGCRPARGSASCLDAIDRAPESHDRLPRRPQPAARAGRSRYIIRLEPGVQTPEETLGRGSGSCRDSGWLLVQIAAPSRPGRALRLRLPDSARARREVARRSGRRRRPTSPICTPGPRSTCPGAGWIGLDPTSGLLAGEGHIPLAATPEPRQRRAGHRRGRRVRGRVRPRDDRAAHPRIAARHQAVHRRAVAGDRRARPPRRSRSSRAGDVRLTMGGEPTFVSIDDMDGAEWNIAALGPRKRELAGDADPASAAAVRARRPAALRPGQVVSRRIAAALGARLLLAPRRRADLERRLASSPTRRSTTGTARRTRGASSWRSPTCWRWIASMSSPRTRTSGTISGRNGGCR